MPTQNDEQVEAWSNRERRQRRRDRNSLREDIELIKQLPEDSEADSDCWHSPGRRWSGGSPTG